MNPDKYYSQGMKSSLHIDREDKFLFQKLFELLEKSVPSNLNYSTRFTFDPHIPGGAFNPEKNEILFGSHLKVNLRNLLGLLHEFGHSVYALAEENKGNLSARINYYDLALNEAYAELWANKIESISEEIRFPLVINWTRVRKQLKFGLLFNLRYHLMYLKFERDLEKRKIMSFSDCRKAHRELGKKFLYVENFPVLFPLMPQIALPGYMPTYLAVNFVAEGLLPKISQKHFFSDCFQIAKMFQGFHSKTDYKRFVQNSFLNYMKTL